MVTLTVFMTRWVQSWVQEFTSFPPKDCRALDKDALSPLSKHDEQTTGFRKTKLGGKTAEQGNVIQVEILRFLWSYKKDQSLLPSHTWICCWRLQKSLGLLTLGRLLCSLSYADHWQRFRTWRCLLKSQSRRKTQQNPLLTVMFWFINECDLNLTEDGQLSMEKNYLIRIT